MQKILSIFLLLFMANFTFAQSYTNWITGDTTDFVTTTYQAGIVLAGGGGDNDDGMKWMLNRAGGGDVVVIRASGSDGYNEYFFSELGVNVNSVETIRFNSMEAATDEYVLTQIQNAEVVFMAGGDQYDYYQYWKDSPVGDALNMLINEKRITVGGTSAGMAILGDAYYAPPGGSLDSDEALGNPFHPDTEIIGKGDFLHAPFLTNVITDTHYDDRERWGRHLTFLARIVTEFESPALGIAANEWVAICVDETGIATVFGEYPDYEEYAYFLTTTCHDNNTPEVIEAGTPLTWDKNGSAVSVYKVPGTIDGENTFDLNDWQTGNGGTWQHWFAIEGELSRISTDSICNLSTATEEIIKKEDFAFYPNPVENDLIINTSDKNVAVNIQIIDVLGKVVFTKIISDVEEKINVENLPKGFYFLEIERDGKRKSQRFLKH